MLVAPRGPTSPDTLTVSHRGRAGLPGLLRGAVGSELSFWGSAERERIADAAGLPPVVHTGPLPATLPIEAAARGHAVPTAMPSVPVPRAGLPRSVLLARHRGGRALPPSVRPALPSPGSGLLAPPPAPLPGQSSGHAGSARRGQRGHSRSALRLQRLPLLSFPGGEGWAEPWDKGLPVVQDGRKPLKCVWGGGHGLGCPLLGTCCPRWGRGCCGHRAPTVALMSPHLCVPCLQVRGNWGSGASGKGSGSRETFPSRTGFGQHRSSWVQPQRFCSSWPGGSGATRMRWLELPR